MAVLRIFGFIVICMNINTGYGYIETYSEHNMCDATIYLGDGLYAVELDFNFLFDRYLQCFTKFDIQDSYKVSYQFISASSISSTCLTTLNISSASGSRTYEFCRSFLFPEYSVTIDDPRNLSLYFESNDDFGTYEMLLYIYKTGQRCDGSNVRCQNGRCIDHGLFCNTRYNFCADQTKTGSCTDDGRVLIDDYSVDKISVIGPICLGLFGFLIFVFLIYFCCRRQRTREICGLTDRTTQRSRPLTARDVYIINVSDASGTPEEGYDYVRDYTKFAAPPEYSSLENIAEASVRYTNSNNIRTSNTDGNSANDSTDGAVGGGRTNEGFVDHEDQELPKYDRVMSNSAEYNVNNNHL